VFGRITRYIDPIVTFGIQAISYSVTHPGQCSRNSIWIHADLTDNDLCRCLRKETPRNLLLHTNEGGKLARRFIDATRIATRGWHLSRLPREEEEDTD